MPLDPNLDVTITPVQITAINDAFDTIFTTLAEVGTVNLSKTERGTIPSVAAERWPYVAKAVTILSKNFPTLVSASVTQERAERLFALSSALGAFNIRMIELADRMTDLGLNAGNIEYEFTRDLYHNGQRYEGKVAGADTIVAELGPLFEGQGNFGDDTPPTT